MADENLKHKHSKDDIIIKDHDGTFKILRDGKFVPLSEVESEAHMAEHGPKRAPEEKGKPVPKFVQPEAPKEEKAEPMPEPDAASGLIDKNLRPQAEEIIEKSGVTFASGEVKARVINALISHVKGIRKPFQTKENLMKSVPDGGAGLTEEDAQRIMSAAGGKEELRRPKMDVSQTKKPKGIMPPPPTPVGKEVSAPPKIAAEAPPPPPPKPKEAPKPKAPAVSPKPAVMDVKKPARATVGMAGELNYSLADWRRVAPNPQDRIKKTENHLGILEEESYPMRLQGLAAWRDSDVFNMYLQAGKKSLEEGKPLQEVLGQGGPDQLSWDEWQAVAELNERIRV